MRCFTEYLRSLISPCETRWKDLVCCFAKLLHWVSRFLDLPDLIRMTATECAALEISAGDLTGSCDGVQCIEPTHRELRCQHLLPEQQV